MKGREIIQAPMGETKVLLHTCCAPCSSAIIEALLNSGITPVIYYCNPNIFPEDEYQIRKNECTRYAQSLGLEIIDADYDHDNWLEAIKGLEKEPERGGRCLRCFKLRLLRTAQYAQERGIKVITTTLASSRWKSLDQINEAGRWACAQVTPIVGLPDGGLMKSSSEDATGPCICHDKYGKDDRSPIPLGVVGLPDGGIIWWDHNWRKGGLQERRLQIIKEYDFYNQLYCGCEFSMRKED